MFFPEKIVSIKTSDKVLEIGPGAYPYSRSDVLLEKRFDDLNLANAQRGFAKQLETKKDVIYYEGGRFPFEDNEFDYVICSHVLEHIPNDELESFLDEIQRVASRGYIEFPSIFYELINYQPVHLWLMNYRDGIIYFLNKDIFKSNYIHKIYREMFYGSDPYMLNTFQRYKELFFCGFEWKEKIEYRIIDDYAELVNEDDFNKFKMYFTNKKEKKNEKKRYKKMLRKIQKIVRTRNSLKIPDYFRMRLKFGNIPDGTEIHSSANFRDLKNITFGKNVKINQGVTIWPGNQEVTVGDYTDLNPYVVIYGKVKIGEYNMIGPHVMLAGGNHRFTNPDKPMKLQGGSVTGIILADDVWVGANSVILDGVKIGKGAIIGAGAVVTEDVEPYSINVGNPAKLVRYRKDISVLKENE